MNKEADRDSPLLFFDSGIGGLSVFNAVLEAIPDAHAIYAADHAFLPYGNKSEEEIATRVPALLGRMVERFDPRLIIIACNTACTIALSHVRGALNIPVVGTVPAIKPAAEFSQSKVIGLLGTEATIRQPYVDQLHADHANDCKLIKAAAPELVKTAESKLRNEALDPDIFTRAILALYDQPDAQNMDAIILGCTHFPLLQEELRKAWNLVSAPASNLKFFDGSAGIARRVTALTQEQSWPAGKQSYHFVTTGTLDDLEPYRPSLEEIGFTVFSQL